MANSKHAHLRYNLIDRYLQNKNYTFDQLRDKLNEEIAEVYPGEGISVRTLREDLKVFRDKEKGFGAPLPGKIRNLCYSDRKFSIATKPLLEYEQYLIDAAYQLLDRFDNHPKYSNLWNALSSFQDTENADSDENYNQILYHDNNEAYEGIKYLKPLFLAIKNKKVLRMTTQNFDGSAKNTFIFHPHILKQYNQRWYAYGYKVNGQLEKVALDNRLVNFEEIIDIEYKRTPTDWDDFFRARVGTTYEKINYSSQKKETIVLRFNKHRLPYFISKPIHPDWDEVIDSITNEVRENEVLFYVVITKELVQQILSYGSDVEVLEPWSLREELKQQSSSLMKLYTS